MKNPFNTYTEVFLFYSVDSFNIIFELDIPLSQLKNSYYYYLIKNKPFYNSFKDHFHAEYI